MSTIKSSAENLTLNADGANNDIKFQSNGSEVASIDQAGTVTATTFTGAATDVYKLPLAGGTMSGNLVVNADIDMTGVLNGTSGSMDIKNEANGENIFIKTTSGGSEVTALKIHSGGTIELGTGQGLRVGGTAAANTLDDYEEGTCTFQYSDGSAGVGSANNGTYTKVGRMVTVSGDIIGNVGSLTSSAALKITGFPFAFSKAGVGPFLTRNFQVPDGTVNVVMYHGGSGTQADIYSFIDHGVYTSALVEDLHASTNDIYFTLTYQTSA